MQSKRPSLVFADIAAEGFFYFRVPDKFVVGTKARYQPINVEYLRMAAAGAGAVPKKFHSQLFHVAEGFDRAVEGFHQKPVALNRPI